MRYIFVFESSDNNNKEYEGIGYGGHRSVEGTRAEGDTLSESLRTMATRIEEIEDEYTGIPD